MLKKRILLIVVCGVVIWLIFLLPKVVVHNDDELSSASDSAAAPAATDMHALAPAEVLSRIRSFRAQFNQGASNEKNAIFADSLAKLYQKTGKFDSSAWFSEESSKFFNTVGSWTRTADSYYQAYTFALDQNKRDQMATKAQEFYGKVLNANPKNLEAKTNLAMTYMSSSAPMRGVALLREVLEEDPANQLALFNLGMLSIQSGQNDRAVGHLEKLVGINPEHTQGQLLLGIAWMNKGEKKKAREQFEKVKKMDQDPAVQATVDSYLKDLK
jgi:tetratricopeptide (TPR) repeat protein